MDRHFVHFAMWAAFITGMCIGALCVIRSARDLFVIVLSAAVVWLVYHGVKGKVWRL